MLKHDWSALKALTHIREKRPIQVMTMDMMICGGGGGGDYPDEYM